MDPFSQNAAFAAALEQPIRRIEIELLENGLFRWNLYGDHGQTFSSKATHPEHIETYAKATRHLMIGACARNMEQTQASAPKN